MRRCPLHQSERVQRLRVREQCLSFPLRNQESRGGRRRVQESREGKGRETPAGCSDSPMGGNEAEDGLGEGGPSRPPRGRARALGPY